MENNVIEVMGMLTGIIISLAFFTAIVLAVYYIVRARNKERLALIEKGGDLSEMYKRKRNGNGFYKVGLTLLGVAIGIAMGGLLDRADILPSSASYMSMILLFAGGAMVLANYLISKKKAV